MWARRFIWLFVCGSLCGVVGARLLLYGPAGDGGLETRIVVGAGRQTVSRDVPDLRQPAGPAEAAEREHRIEVLDEASLVPESLRGVYMAEVATAGADLDPESFFDYGSHAIDIEGLSAGLELLIPTDPIRVFELASRLAEDNPLSPGTNRVQIAAIRALADRDVAAAAGLLDAMPGHSAPSDLMRSVASRYGRSNPDAALAWLDSLDVTDAVRQSIRESLVAGIAVTDFDRGFALALLETIEESAP